MSAVLRPGVVVTAALSALCWQAVACRSASPGPCEHGRPSGAAPPAGHVLWCTDAAGKKHGVFREWYPSDQLKTEASFFHGKQHGAYVAYHLTGAKKEEGVYDQGVRKGHWKEWYENGKLYRESDHDGTPVVHFVLYDETDGHKWIEFNLQDGAEHGHYVEWYAPDRKTAEGEYLKGQKVGTWQYWLPDGTPTPDEQGFSAKEVFAPE